VGGIRGVGGNKWVIWRGGKRKGNPGVKRQAKSAATHDLVMVWTRKGGGGKSGIGKRKRPDRVVQELVGGRWEVDQGEGGAQWRYYYITRTQQQRVKKREGGFNRNKKKNKRSDATSKKEGKGKKQDEGDQNEMPPSDLLVKTGYLER